MVATTDYLRQGRHRSDRGYRVHTRDRITFGSVVLLPVPTRSSAEQAIQCPIQFQYRWDLLADRLLGDVNLKWILMRHNKVAEPFNSPTAGDTIRVPTAEQIRYYRGLENPDNIVQ